MPKSRHRLWSVLLIVTCWLFSGLSVISAQTGAVRFKQIEEVVSRWNADQHLYLKGDLRIGDAQLDELEDWLDQNGPHWTVVLMQSAGEQRYTDAEGRTFYGLDAVEYALGHGLANRTGFGRLEHPETKETDGAVFVLFLQERKFSYYGSDAQDRRGLGESRWMGDLDREAIRAMRGGGRIIDAVKNTVTEINEQLSAKISAEKAAAEQQKRQAELEQQERERTLANTLARIGDSESKLLSEIERAARLFQQTYPEAANSSLAAPPLDKWKVQLNEFRATITAENARRISQLVEQQRNELETFLDGYAVHRNFVEAIEPLQSRWDQVTTFGRGLATESSREAEIQLSRAKELHRQGDIAFVAALDQARLALDRADEEIFAEKRRLEAEAAQRRAIRNALYGAGGILLLVTGLIGWWLNRRRRPTLLRATEAFDKTSRYIHDRLAPLEAVLTEAPGLLGNAKSFSQRGYTGQTAALGQQLLEQQEQLSKLVAEAQRVLRKADGTLHPLNPFSQLANLISAAPYEHCLNLLAGQSLKLPPGLEHLDEVQPIGWMGFAEYSGIVQRLGEDLRAGLSRFRDAASMASAEAAAFQSDLDTLVAMEKANAELAKQDGLFELPGLFEQLLPTLQAIQDEAENLVNSDPVRAREELLSEGKQRVADVRAIVEAIATARQKLWPELQATTQELEELGLRTGWLKQRLGQLSEIAKQLIATANVREITNESQQFTRELGALLPLLERSRQLARTLDRETAQSLSKLAETIVSGRQRVATALGLVPGAALAEASYNPDLRLEAARKQLQAARAALDYGKVSVAEDALQTLAVETKRAEQLVEESLEVLQNFDANLERVQSRSDQLKARLEESAQAIAQARTRYLPTALDFRWMTSAPGTTEAAQPAEAAALSVAACQTSCDELWKDSQQALQKGAERFRQGQLLEAANLVHLAEEELAVIEVRLGGIAQHLSNLAATEQQNTELAGSLGTRVQQLAEEGSDARITQTTQTQLQQLQAAAARLLPGLAAPGNAPRDPLQDVAAMESLSEEIDELRGRLTSDREAHAEASRAVAGAKRELEVALELVERSRTDQIPDSATVTRCQKQIEQLGQQVAATAREVSSPHAEWADIHRAASRQTAELGRVTGELQNELELARHSLEDFEQASQEVYRAASWSGSYGIRVVNNPGVEELEQARTALARGDYQQTLEFSQAAVALAVEAIAIAERMVARKRREIQTREAQRRRRSNDDFWGGFGGGIFTGGGGGGWSSGGGGWSSRGGSWSSGSSSGGSWGGSSGGSGSGFGRSGW